MTEEKPPIGQEERESQEYIRHALQSMVELPVPRMPRRDEETTEEAPVRSD